MIKQVQRAFALVGVAETLTKEEMNVVRKQFDIDALAQSVMPTLAAFVNQNDNDGEHIAVVIDALKDAYPEYVI